MQEIVASSPMYIHELLTKKSICKTTLIRTASDARTLLGVDDVYAYMYRQR